MINSCSSTLATPVRLQSVDIWASVLVRGWLYSIALPRPTTATQLCISNKSAPGKHLVDQSTCLFGSSRWKNAVTILTWSEGSHPSTPHTVRVGIPSSLSQVRPLRLTMTSCILLFRDRLGSMLEVSTITELENFTKVRLRCYLISVNGGILLSMAMATEARSSLLQETLSSFFLIQFMEHIKNYLKHVRIFFASRPT